MAEEKHNGQSPSMGEETRAVMDALSTKLLRLHKQLLDDAKKSYEEKNGPIASVNASRIRNQRCWKNRIIATASGEHFRSPRPENRPDGRYFTVVTSPSGCNRNRPTVVKRTTR